MRVDNLTWHPVRLGMRRVRPNAWHISREEEVVGEVFLHRDGSWWAARGSIYDFDGAGRRRTLWTATFDSFVAAALSVSRLRHVHADSDGPQDLGDARVLRVCVSPRWYTVLLKRGERYIYEDHTIPEKLTDEQQARLQLVLTEVDRWEAGNL